MRKYQNYYTEPLNIANAVVNSKNLVGQPKINLPVNEAKMAMNIADAVKNTAMDVGNYTLDTGKTWANSLAAIPQAMQGVQPKDYKDVVKITPSESSARGQELVNSFIFSNPQTGITLPQGYGDVVKTYAKQYADDLAQGAANVGRVFNPNYGLAIENAVMNNTDDVVKNTATYYDDAGTAVSNAVATNTDDAEKALIEKFKTKGLSSLTPEEKKKIMEMPSERITEIANGFKPGERLAGDRQIQAGTKSYDDVYKNSVGYGGSKVDDVQAGLNETASKFKSAKEFYLRMDDSTRDALRQKGIRGEEAITDFWNKNAVKTEPILDTLNPTGSLYADYNPQSRMTMKLGKNITTYDKTAGLKPDDLVTVYRGTSKEKINPGDYITTNYDLAKSYNGDGKVAQLKVKASDILDDINEPLGDEYIYRPQSNVANQSSVPQPAGLYDITPQNFGSKLAQSDPKALAIDEKIRAIINKDRELQDLSKAIDISRGGLLGNADQKLVREMSDKFGNRYQSLLNQELGVAQPPVTNIKK